MATLPPAAPAGRMDEIAWLRSVAALTTGEPLRIAEAAGFTPDQMLALWARVRDQAAGGTGG